MIYVSQGHEKSISLEIFLKNFSLLRNTFCTNLVLYCFKDSLEKTLKTLNIAFKLTQNGITFNQQKLNCVFLTDESSPQSSVCLNSIMERITEDDILITLPTSKDQLYSNNKLVHGHTEFFREHYSNNDISMNFAANDISIMLLTDHIPLRDVSSIITAELVIEKTKQSIEGYRRIGIEINEVIFSGINPHAGENGLLGTEEKSIITAMKKIKNATGPISGDMMHSFHKNKEQLLVFTNHDQALSFFKSKYRFNGINITFGLPFLRFSVDHGTAFDLYGKNTANYQGLFYLFKWLDKRGIVV